MLLLSDTHCHIDLEPFDIDRQIMLERAWQSGIQRILIPGVDLVSSRRAITLAESDTRIFAAVGVHPNNGKAWDDNSMAELRDLAGHPRVCAIGEIGLDFYRKHTTPDFQRRILLEQLALASEFDKPVILHCREAFNELISILHAWLTELPHPAFHLRSNPESSTVFQVTVRRQARWYHLASGWVLTGVLRSRTLTQPGKW